MNEREGQWLVLAGSASGFQGFATDVGEGTVSHAVFSSEGGPLRMEPFDPEGGTFTGVDVAQDEAGGTFLMANLSGPVYEFWSWIARYDDYGETIFPPREIVRGSSSNHIGGIDTVDVTSSGATLVTTGFSSAFWSHWYSASGEDLGATATGDTAGVLMDGAVVRWSHDHQSEPSFETAAPAAPTESIQTTAAPDWINETPRARFQALPGRSGYAVIENDSGTSCGTTVQVRSPSGVLCAVVKSEWPGGCAPPDVTIGRDGTLIQTATGYSEPLCTGHSCTCRYWWWPHLLK